MEEQQNIDPQKIANQNSQQLKNNLQSHQNQHKQTELNTNIEQNLKLKKFQNIEKTDNETRQYLRYSHQNLHSFGLPSSARPFIQNNGQNLENTKVTDTEYNSNIESLQSPSGEQNYGALLIKKNQNQNPETSRFQQKRRTFQPVSKHSLKNIGGNSQNFIATRRKGKEPSQIQLNEKNPGKFLQLQTKATTTENNNGGLRMRVFYIKRFINIMKSKSTKLRFHQLKFKQIALINDNASDYQYFQSKDYFMYDKTTRRQRIYNKIQQSLLGTLFQSNNEIFGVKIKNLVLLPNSYTQLLWKSMVLILLMANIVYIPLRLSFKFDQTEVMDLIMNRIPQYVYVLEIILNFNTAIYKEGILVTNRTQIFINYIQGSFWYDLFIVITFTIGNNSEGQGSDVIELILLLRFVDIIQIYKELEERFKIRQKFEAISELSKLVTFILYLSHFVACAWHYIAVQEISSNSKEQNWLNDNIDTPWERRYSKALYWSVVTMTTIGYGDIAAESYYEEIFIIFVGLLSCLIFAYAMTSIGDIMKELGNKSRHFKQKSQNLDVYMEKRGLNPMIQQRVKKYFEYLLIEQSQDNQEASVFLNNNLASSLKEEVLQDLYGKLLSQKKIFRLRFSTEFINQISLQVKETRTFPEEDIYKMGSKSDKIYIIIKGQVENVRYVKNNKGVNKPIRLNTLRDGDIFGEIGFFSNKTRNSTMRSVNVTNLAYIEQEDFMKTIKSFPFDYESLMMISHNINFYDNHHGLNTKCPSCDSYTHYLDKCPFVTVKNDKQKVIYCYNYSENQRRQNKQRQRKKLNSLKNKKINEEEAFQLIVVDNALDSDTFSDDDEGSSLSDSSFEASMMYSNVPNTLDDQNQINQYYLESSSKNLKPQKKRIFHELAQKLKSRKSQQMLKSIISEPDSQNKVHFLLEKLIEKEIKKISNPTSRNNSNSNINTPLYPQKISRKNTQSPVKTKRKKKQKNYTQQIENQINQDQQQQNYYQFPSNKISLKQEDREEENFNNHNDINKNNPNIKNKQQKISPQIKNKMHSNKTIIEEEQNSNSLDLDVQQEQSESYIQPTDCKLSQEKIEIQESPAYKNKKKSVSSQISSDSSDLDSIKLSVQEEQGEEKQIQKLSNKDLKEKQKQFKINSMKNIENDQKQIQSTSNKINSFENLDQSNNNNNQNKKNKKSSKYYCIQQGNNNNNNQRSQYSINITTDDNTQQQNTLVKNQNQSSKQNENNLYLKVNGINNELSSVNTSSRKSLKGSPGQMAKSRPSYMNISQQQLTLMSRSKQRRKTEQNSQHQMFGFNQANSTKSIKFSKSQNKGLSQWLQKGNKKSPLMGNSNQKSKRRLSSRKVGYQILENLIEQKTDKPTNNNLQIQESPGINQFTNRNSQELQIVEEDEQTMINRIRNTWYQKDPYSGIIEQQFDQVKTFKVYYPYNNIDFILKWYNKQRKQFDHYKNIAKQEKLQKKNRKMQQHQRRNQSFLKHLGSNGDNLLKVNQKQLANRPSFIMQQENQNELRSNLSYIISSNQNIVETDVVQIPGSSNKKQQND